MTVYANGRLSQTAQVSKGHPAFDAVLTYWNSSGITAGTWTLAAHAPGLVIEAATMRVNFQKTQVVVSTRIDGNDVWHPVVRTKSPEDARLEAVVAQLLNPASQ